LKKAASPLLGEANENVLEKKKCDWGGGVGKRACRGTWGDVPEIDF